MVKELFEYTDEELRAEIKRRAIIKAKETRKQNSNNVGFWTGKVIEVRKGNYSGLFGLEFVVESEFIYSKTHYSISYFKLAQNVGFNKDNKPKVGDKVKLKYKVSKDSTKTFFNVLSSKIVEIL